MSNCVKTNHKLHSNDQYGLLNRQKIGPSEIEFLLEVYGIWYDLADITFQLHPLTGIATFLKNYSALICLLLSNHYCIFQVSFV